MELVKRLCVLAIQKKQENAVALAKELMTMVSARGSNGGDAHHRKKLLNRCCCEGLTHDVCCRVGQDCAPRERPEGADACQNSVMLSGVRSFGVGQGCTYLAGET